MFKEKIQQENFSNPGISQVQERIKEKPGELILTQEMYYKQASFKQTTVSYVNKPALQIEIILPETRLPNPKNMDNNLLENVLRPVWIIPGGNFNKRRTFKRLYLNSEGRQEPLPWERRGNFQETNTFNARTLLENMHLPPEIPRDSYPPLKGTLNPPKPRILLPIKKPRLEFYIGNQEVMQFFANPKTPKIVGWEFAKLDKMVGIHPETFGRRDPHYGTSWNHEQEEFYKKFESLERIEAMSLVKKIIEIEREWNEIEKTKRKKSIEERDSLIKQGIRQGFAESGIVITRDDKKGTRIRYDIEAFLKTRYCEKH